MSNNNKMPEGWGQNKSVPDSWKKANSLPENWGTKKNGAAKKTPSVRSPKVEERTESSDTNVAVSESVNTGTPQIEINNAIPDSGSLSTKIVSSGSESLSSPKIEKNIVNDTETDNESNSFENVSYEKHTEIEVSTTNESPQVNITPINNADSTKTADDRIAINTSSSGRILLSEEAADLDAKISYLKKEKSLKEHELKNTSAMSANKRELKNEVDDYSQVLSGGLSELHSVNASDVLKYCSAEDVVGQTVSYGSLNGDFIEWTIIENTKQSVTMLSNEIVFHSPFDLSDDPSIVYKNSYIRQLLNAPQFMTKFFTLEEAVHITGISLPRQEDIAIVSNPDLNETYWMLSFSSSGDDTPLAMNNYGNIIGESVSKNLGVRLKLKISPDMNYDIIKVYEEQENNPPQTGSDTKKILTIASGAVAAIALIVGGVFVSSKLIHKSSSDSSSKNDDIVVSDVLNGNTNDANENAVPSGAEITSNAVTEMDATSDSTGENATATEEQTSPGITGRKLQFYPSDKIKDYPAYLEKLRDMQNTGMYRDQNNGFFLCDINEDDIPELFVTFNTEEPDILFAGSVYSGELVTFAEFTGAGMLRGITLFDNGAIGIASGGNEGHGMSYKYYSGGNSFSDQNNNDESISYIYENGSLSYISYQNGGQEKHISEAEAEQVQQKYVEAVYTAEPVSSVIDNGSNMQSSQYSGFTFFDSIDKVKSELSNYYLIDEEDSVSISNQNQHLIYYKYPAQENIDAQICLCFIDNKLIAVNFRFVSATYTTAEIFNNIRDNISAKYGQPDSSDTGALNWFVEPFGPATYFFLYSYDNIVQLSFFTVEDNPYINDLLPIDVSNTFLTLS